MNEEMINSSASEPGKSGKKKAAIVTIIIVIALAAVVTVSVLLISGNSYTGRYYRWSYTYSSETNGYEWVQDKDDYFDLKFGKKWEGSDKFDSSFIAGDYKIQNGKMYMYINLFGTAAINHEFEIVEKGFCGWWDFYFKEGYTPSKSPKEYRNSTSN